MATNESSSARKRSHTSHSSCDFLENVHFIDEENLTQSAIKGNKHSFAIQNINIVYLKEVINSNAQLKTSKLQQRINFLTKGCEALVGLMKVKAFPFESLSYEEFLSFSSEALDVATSSVKIYEYLPYIKGYTNLTTFVSSVRASSGPQFVNYTVTQRDQTGKVIPPSQTSVFYTPSLYIYPEEEVSQAGVDVYSIRKSLIDAALANPSEAITSGKVVLLSRYQGATAFRMMKAIYSSIGDVKGIASIIIVRDQLLIDISSDTYAFDYLVLDKNETNWNNSIIYSSPYFNNLPYQVLMEVLAVSPLAVTADIKFGYRQWQLFAIPTNSFIERTSSAQKWIALFGCIIASFFAILAVILCFAIVGNVYRTHIMTKSRMKIVLMAQDNLKKLINKISNQEQKARFILDSIHDCMLIVNTTSGKIKTANRSFTVVYQYEEEDWKSLHISAILPALTQEFFSNNTTSEGNQIDETLSRSRAGIIYKVTVAQKPIPNNENMPFCLVIVRLLADSSGTFNQLFMKNKAAIYDFASSELLLHLQQKGTEFYTAFKNFCKQEFTLDTLECVEKIEQYKKIKDVEYRIKLQQDILNTYLTERAPKQVNVSSKVLQKQRNYLGDGLGLCLNSYARFKEMMSKIENSDTRSSLKSSSTHSNTTGNSSEGQIKICDSA